MGSVNRGPSIAGTLGYMAPEQPLGRASEKSDVFSLVLTIVEALFDRDPLREYSYSVTDVTDYVHATSKTVSEVVEWIRDLNLPREIIGSLEFIVRNGLAIELSDRLSMKGLRDKLLELIQMVDLGI